MTEDTGGTGRRPRRRAIVIGVAAVGVAVAVAVGIVLGTGARRERSAGTEAAVRIISAYAESLRKIRKDQRATSDPYEVTALAAKERRLRVLTAVGLGGVLERSGESELREAIEDEVREILSAFPNSSAVIEEIEGPYFQELARADPGFARDLTGLLAFLVREESRGIEEKRRELEDLKRQRAEIRKGLESGAEGHEGHGHEGNEHEGNEHEGKE
ncbi:MAG: hypothetical protein ACYS9X_08810 [Planctomycetota bacterium]|jgi:hypothetical protein